MENRMNGDIVMSYEEYQQFINSLNHPDSERIHLCNRVFSEAQESVHVRERRGTDAVVDFPNLNFRPRAIENDFVAEIEKDIEDEYGDSFSDCVFVNNLGCIDWKSEWESDGFECMYVTGQSDSDVESNSYVFSMSCRIAA